MTTLSDKAASNDAGGDDSALAAVMLRRRASQGVARNRPAWMLLIAGALLAAAALWAVVSSASVAGAETFYRSRTVNAGQIVQSISRLEQLEARIETTPGLGPEAAAVRPISLLQNAAQRAGLEEPDLPSERDETTSGGARRKLYIYNDVESVEITPLLAWLGEIRTEAPFMEIGSLRIENRGPAGWRMDVTFQRLESRE